MRYDPKVVLAWFKQHGLTPVAEHRFHPERKWRFDFCFPESKLALEVEGGIWTAGGGRHNRPAGFLKDIEKYNTAAMLGWRILRTTPSELCMQETVDTIKTALRGTI